MGCFPGDSVVTTSFGEKKLMKDLRVGESVLALSDDGLLRLSKVLLFLDRSETALTKYVTLVTNTGKSITATPTHLVLRWEKPERSQIRHANPVYAKRVRINDTLLTVVGDNAGGRRLRTERVVDVRHTEKTGLYAPLTVDGTVVVDNVVASCYAVLDNQWLAHLAFLPVRMVAAARTSLYGLIWRLGHPLSLSSADCRDESSLPDTVQPADGIHWYPRMLYAISDYVIPAGWIDSH